MAESLLKAWGAPAVVSAVEIDAASRQVARAENTTVTGLTVGRTVSWSQKDAALPMPVSLRDRSVPIAVRRGAPTMDLALSASDFMQALNQQTLRVRGLEAARYTLKINGSVTGSFSREQLTGSAQEFDGTRILGCFLEGDKFGPGRGHALGLQK